MRPREGLKSKDRKKCVNELQGKDKLEINNAPAEAVVEVEEAAEVEAEEVIRRVLKCRTKPDRENTRW